LEGPVRLRLQPIRDGMQGRYIQTGPQKQIVLFIPRLLMLDALGGSRNDIRKETLMFSIRIGKKPADGINFLVLMFEMGADDFGGAALFFQGNHAGMDFVVIGVDSVMDSVVNILIKQDFQ
jgi:hypothetical protein